MKKLLAIAMAGLLTLSLAACGAKDSTDANNNQTGQNEKQSEEKKESDAKDGEKIKVALLISGNLGDMSFNDSANAGALKAQEALGVDVRVVECNSDSSKYEPTLLEFSDEGYDMVIVSTNFIEFVEMYADDYPDTTYVVFDGEVDYAKGDFKNVNCILYKANEASFLGGYVAAELTKSGASGMNDDKVIGFLGGMDQPVINDFLVGFIQGAQYADPDVKVASVYSNSFSDSAKGKELTISMIGQGADVCFNVAGGAGIGLIEACVEKNLKVIGVDSDQAMIFEANKPEFSKHIPTSVLKNVGDSLYRAIELYTKGELVTAETEFLGIAEGGVGLADNKYYQEQVPQEIRDKVAELEDKILKGEITINTAIGTPVEEVTKIITDARP
ncbi:BMP family ABC transporter substrate-binding protein [Anaeropeptidivorans aminofermentans]|jgi:basic membrane protein A|uniref:BMP family ABC transporter substrate-binding protein n=1 Tax=Anaeropeptidivorans aminofermentans TaxID=2934315 RepID=UPI0020255B85|nr:BMP family ABC transporter substrate-binding protein [Anaeropeptidivorans aminofermentans]